MNNILKNSMISVILLFLTAVSVHGAEETSKPKPTEEATSSRKRIIYANINFVEMYKTNINFLSSIGAEIDKAIQEADMKSLLEYACKLRLVEKNTAFSSENPISYNLCKLIADRAEQYNKSFILLDLMTVLNDSKSGFGTQKDKKLSEIVKQKIKIIIKASKVRTRGVPQEADIKIVINNMSPWSASVSVYNDPSTSLGTVKHKSKLVATYKTSRDEISLFAFNNDREWGPVKRKIKNNKVTWKLTL